MYVSRVELPCGLIRHQDARTKSDQLVEESTLLRVRTDVAFEHRPCALQQVEKRTHIEPCLPRRGLSHQKRRKGQIGGLVNWVIRRRSASENGEDHFNLANIRHRQEHGFCGVPTDRANPRCSVIDNDVVVVKPRADDPMVETPNVVARQPSGRSSWIVLVFVRECIESRTPPTRQ